MSQAYGRMYHPTPHHHTHHNPPTHHQVHAQGPPYRPSGESAPNPGGYPHRGYHQNHYGSPPPRPGPSHYNNSVSVYSVPKPSRPYNNYSNRRSRGGGNTGRGGYHNNHNNHPQGNHNSQGYNNHTHNNYRPHPPDYDLEWDHYDLDSEKPKGKPTARQRNSYSQHGGGPTLHDAELEWDDYDLRPKKEKEEREETVETLDYILTEGVFPLIGVVTKAPLSRGHIPLGAIQVCRFPQGGASFKTLASSDHLSKSLRLNKELLVLTSELNESAFFSGLDSPSESKEFLLADLELTRDKDSSSSPTDTPSKDGESEGASNGISSEDLDEDFLNDTYESGYQDRLGDIDLYALAPHDFDSPDSTFSRSLADLTDVSLYEELGIDPSLLRHSLERSRSLGDATRAQDASKDRSLKGLKAKKRKRKGPEKIEESSSGVGDEGSEKKTKRLAPNFFVAVQVSSSQIHEALKDVQQTVVSGDEKLKDAMVPIATLHLTIMVMHLATEEDVERAKIALNECHRLLSPRFMKEKLSILFGGLGHFNNQVMFAKIKDQDSILENLYEIADTVEKCFSEYQLVSTGERGFKPHLTVMKLSRAPSLRKKGVRRIKSELYKTHSTQVFGTQVVEGLQLCSINKPKTPDGYYCKAAEVFFGDPACRPDRDIHTIAEGEEPPVESLNETDSELTNNTSEPTDTRSSPKGALETEENMDCNGAEAGVKTRISDPRKYEHLSNQNNSLDVKHQSSPRPICESVMNSENFVSGVDEQKQNLCRDSDITQDTPSGKTSDAACPSPSETNHNGPSDTPVSTPGDITRDTTPSVGCSSNASSIEQLLLPNGDRNSTESAMECETVERSPSDVPETGPKETC